jgi:hypothetical protein
MEDKRVVQRVFVGTPGGTRQRLRPRRAGMDNINTFQPEWESMVWTERLWTEISGELLLKLYEPMGYIKYR